MALANSRDRAKTGHTSEDCGDRAKPFWRPALRLRNFTLGAPGNSKIY
jgi:hypothetical protein